MGGWKIVKKNKIRALKSGSLPAKADAEKQREFCENTLYQLMEKAKNGIINLQFMDGSHFVMGCDFLGRIYGKTRRFVRTLSGRKRYNVLGALDFVTKEVTTVSNDAYLNGESVCDLLRKLSMKSIGQAMYVILDNARYQKCKLVQELAERIGITLVYIPPYSPNLNLIERLWGFVKKNLRTKYYDNFDEFKERIDSLINSTDKENKKIIDQLIGKKIQLFDDLVPVNENTFVKSKVNGTLAA